MTKAAKAAEIWAQLEKALVGQLMSGSQLDLKRPFLIRLIGDRLEARNVDVCDTPATAHRQAPKSVISPANRGAPRRKTVPITESTDWRRIDSIHDPVLAAMLEKSCSRRSGYDGDDEVTYEPGTR